MSVRFFEWRIPKYELLIYVYSTSKERFPAATTLEYATFLGYFLMEINTFVYAPEMNCKARETEDRNASIRERALRGRAGTELPLYHRPERGDHFLLSYPTFIRSSLQKQAQSASSLVFHGLLHFICFTCTMVLLRRSGRWTRVTS
jgi:hypothetical protein